MQTRASEKTAHPRTKNRWISCLKLAIALGVLALAASGCASAITAASPPYTKEVEQGTHVEDEVRSYEYDLKSLSPVYSFQLHRTPLCPEKARMQRISRKQPRGFVLALAEMPLYGLGLLDWLYAKSISEESEEVLDTWLEPTDKLMPCGEPELASGEVVILQTPREIDVPQKTVHTDSEGKLELESVLVDHFRFGLVNLFVLSDGDLKYLRSIYI